MVSADLPEIILLGYESSILKWYYADRHLLFWKHTTESGDIVQALG